jgi:polysaccharide biosynthesis transport protein
MDGENSTEHAAQGRDEAIDPARLIARIRRRWRWILLSAGVAALLSGAFVLFASPRYTGVAKVLLEDRQSYHTRPDLASGSDLAATTDLDAVQREVEAVASPELARRAIDKLELATNPEFNASASSKTLGEIDQRVIDKFLSRLTVVPAAKSRVLQIEFVSRDPQLAARGANTVAEIFLESQREAKANAAMAESAWSSRKIEELRAKVAEAEAKVETFRVESGLSAGANGQTTRQLSDLNAQVANARSAQATAASKAALLRKLQTEGQLAGTPESVMDESMHRFAEQRVALKAQITEAARVLPPKHPRMKELAAQLASLKNQIRDAAAKNIRALENDARLAGDQVASLSATLAQQAKPAAAGNGDDMRLRGLEMEAKASRDELESYLQKYRDAAREVDNAAPTDASIISTALPPRVPTFLKAWQTIVLATLAAVVLSTGVAGATRETEMTLRRVRRATAQTLGSPALARDDIALRSEPSPGEIGAEARPAIWGFHSAEALARHLAQERPTEGALVVLIVGHRCGQALPIAIETARRLAADGATSLVDLGVTQEWFSDIVDREGAFDAEIPGLIDLLEGNASFGDIIRRDLSSDLDIICAGGDLSGVEGFDDALSALASAYGRIVVHASDWRTAPASAAAERSDVIVVAAPGIRLREAVQAASKELGASGAEILAFAAQQGRSAFDEAA